MVTNRACVIVVGCHVSGLGVLRALGNRGLHLIALRYEEQDFAYVSRYASEVITVPHPRTDQAAFIQYLLERSSDWSGALVVDTDDSAAVALAKYKRRLCPHYRISTADWSVLRQFLEKKNAHALAEATGVPHPKNFLPKCLADIERLKHEVQFPCLLKPVRGHEFLSVLGVKNFEVNSAQELEQKFSLCLQQGQEVMLQEIVPGPDTLLYKMQAYVNSRNDLAAKFFWKKERQHPPMFGVGRVGVSMERNPEVEDLARRLLRQANYQGYFSIEFKKDPRDGALKLMEVNVRMPRNNLLATAAGVNFPWIIYQDLVQDIQVKIDEYEKDFWWIELPTDLYNICINHRRERFTFREYLKPYLSKKVFAIFSLTDPVPFFFLMWKGFSNSLSSFVRRVVRKQPK